MSYNEDDLDQIREWLYTVYRLNKYTGQYVKTDVCCGWHESWKRITKEEYEELKQTQPDKEYKNSPTPLA